MSGLGVGGGRSAADEQVIDALRVSGSSKSPAVLYIVDARPLLNAHANKVVILSWWDFCFARFFFFLFSKDDWRRNRKHGVVSWLFSRAA
jgi:hypothetical protein